MLPTNLFEKPKRPLSSLRIGESGYVRIWNMLVSASGACYLEPHASLLTDTTCMFHLRVERKSDGYHVAVLDRRSSWKPETGESDFPKLIPVASVTEAYEPDPLLDHKELWLCNGSSSTSSAWPFSRSAGGSGGDSFVK